MCHLIERICVCVPVIVCSAGWKTWLEVNMNVNNEVCVQSTVTVGGLEMESSPLTVNYIERNVSIWKSGELRWSTEMVARSATLPIN